MSLSRVPLSTEILRAYQNILTLHRQKLSGVMRSLGDDYVRKEFKAIKEAKPPQVEHFLKEWQKYAHILESRQDDNIGQTMGNQIIKRLNNDQKQQLDKLKANLLPNITNRSPPVPKPKPI